MLQVGSSGVAPGALQPDSLEQAEMAGSPSVASSRALLLPVPGGPLCQPDDNLNIEAVISSDPVIFLAKNLHVVHFLLLVFRPLLTYFSPGS